MLQPKKHAWLASATLVATLAFACGPVTRSTLVCNEGESLSLEMEVLSHSQLPLTGDESGSAASRNLWLFNTSHGNRTVVLSRASTANGQIHQGTFSSDGNWIAAHANWALDGSATGTALTAYNLWLVKADGSESRALTSHTTASVIAKKANFSPNNAKLVFEANMAVSGATNATASSYNIWSVNSDGTGLTALTQNSIAGRDSINALFSPSGNQILFTSYTDVSGGWDGASSTTSRIWIMDADGGNRTLLTGGRNSQSASFSPDGTKILFVSSLNLDGNWASAASAVTNLWTMSLTGTGLAALTSSTVANFRDPAYSPDGRYVAYLSNRSLTGAWDAAVEGSYNVWVYDSRSGTHTAITQTSAAGFGHAAPYFLTDSSRVVFVSDLSLTKSWVAAKEAVLNVWTAAPDGTNLQSITQATSGTMPSSITNAMGANVSRYVLACRNSP